jgi:hypothetical protein
VYGLGKKRLKNLISSSHIKDKAHKSPRCNSSGQEQDQWEKIYKKARFNVKESYLSELLNNVIVFLSKKWAALPEVLSNRLNNSGYLESASVLDGWMDGWVAQVV